MSELKQKVVKGMFWALLEKFGVKGVSFVVAMVLARLLTPADYGTVALLTIFLTIAGCLTDSGFGTALVQKKEATELDFNSVFFISVGVSGFFYVLLFFAAPAIAAFYETPVLVPVLRVLAISLVLNAINSVQNVELQRKLLFNLSFRISMIGIVVSGAVGITLAVLHYGVWAIVWSQLANDLVGVITRWYFIAWRPKLMFSWRAAKGLFHFGWKMAVSGLLDTTYQNLYGLLIGRLYKKDDLAYVNKGRSVPELAMSAINGTLMQVSFPALAQLQDKRDVLREAMRKMIRISTFFVFPLMTGVACTADSLVVILFGDQWRPAVPYVCLSCFTFALWPFHTINLQAVKALGRSDIYLKLEIIKKVLGLVILFVSVPFGVFWMMAAFAFVTGPLCVIVNAWPNCKLLNYSVAQQVRDVLPFAASCGVMAAVLMPVNFIVPSLALRLALKAMAGIAVYGALALFVQRNAIREIVGFLPGGSRLRRIADRFVVNT